MLEVNASIPKLDVVLQNGESRSLSTWKGRWLVVFFYPKDNTPGCTTENRDFSALAADFEAAGAALLGVSRDSAKTHQNFCGKHELQHELVADTDSVLCDGFGVIQEKLLYGRRYMGIERSTFLITPKQKVHTVWRKVKVKDHAATVLEALRAAVHS